MNRSLWLIVALLAGLAIGALLRAYDPALADSAIMLADPVGTLWVNAIRMTVIPLVVSTVLAALLAPGARELFAQLGWRVIRIESTPSGAGLPGDPNRYIGSRVADDDRRSYFIGPNVGKEAIALRILLQSGQRS